MKWAIAISTAVHIILFYTYLNFFTYSGKKVVLHKVYTVDIVTLPLQKKNKIIKRPKKQVLSKRVLKKRKKRRPKVRRKISVPKKKKKAPKPKNKKTDLKKKGEEEEKQIEREETELLDRLLAMEKKWLKDKEKVKETLEDMTEKNSIERDKYIDSLKSLEKEWTKYTNVVDRVNVNKNIEHIKKMLGLGYSGEILLNSKSNFPAYYLDIIQNIIYGNWAPPFKKDKEMGKKVVVKFRILKNGTIKGTSIEASSNDRYLDKSAIKAVEMARQLPPLPAEINDDSIIVHLSFEFKANINNG